MQEIEVTLTYKDEDGEIKKKKYTDEINANYSRRKIKQLVRADFYGKPENRRKTLSSVKVREEAEIYQNY